MTKSLDLKLTNEEKQNLWQRAAASVYEDDMQTICGIYANLVEKAATAKAAWEIVEWLFDAQYYQERLADILEAAGISPPK